MTSGAVLVGVLILGPTRTDSGIWKEPAYRNPTAGLCASRRFTGLGFLGRPFQNASSFAARGPATTRSKRFELLCFELLSTGCAG